MSLGSANVLPEGNSQVYVFHQDLESETQNEMQMDFGEQSGAHIDSFTSTSGPHDLLVKLNNATSGFEVLDIIFRLPEVTGKGGQKPTFTRVIKVKVNKFGVLLLLNCNEIKCH
jgi:hypothetical protein